MITDLRKTPFPWFGGKADAAPVVWELLGDVDHYVEPFAGSLAVLLRRPHECNRTYYSETVNDKDGLLVNAWRGMQMHPEATADAASWPVSEADMHARHLAILRWERERELERLMADPSFCDPKIAGWWLWGICCWIGGHWASGQGAWIVGSDGRITKRTNGEPGVSRQLPHLGSNGQGVNRPQLREPGVGDFHPMTMPELLRWFQFLSARLRHVRILNGDWARACTTGASHTLPVRQGGHAGIFLDPPYADTADRSDLYSHESFTVAHDVAAWALEAGKNPRNRIVLAGYDGEHGSKFADAGWTEHEWFTKGYLKGGMAQQGKDGTQQKRERLWSSPHCLRLVKSEPAQASLFGDA